MHSFSHHHSQPGTWSAANATVCTDCSAGYSCTATTQTLCPAGYWAPTKSVACLPCSPGYICGLALAPHISPTPAGGLCAQGGWCDGANRIECPDGFFGNHTGAGTFVAACELCPSGFVCSTSYGSHLVPLACPVGYFCPAGTSALSFLVCPRGTYGITTAAETLAEGATRSLSLFRFSSFAFVYHLQIPIFSFSSLPLLLLLLLLLLCLLRRLLLIPTLTHTHTHTHSHTHTLTHPSPSLHAHTKHSLRTLSGWLLLHINYLTTSHLPCRLLLPRRHGKARPVPVPRGYVQQCNRPH
jgi:hypothetical protein